MEIRKKLSQLLEAYQEDLAEINPNLQSLVLSVFHVPGERYVTVDSFLDGKMGRDALAATLAAMLQHSSEACAWTEEEAAYELKRFTAMTIVGRDIAGAGTNVNDIEI